MPNDPLQALEKTIHNIHDKAGKHTQPVLNRYPLLFAFLLVFSAAAILHGFDMWADKIPLFEGHPLYLVGVGVIALVLTGTLYRVLEKME